MKKLILLSLLMVSSAFSAQKDPRCYELRVYYATPGKLDDLHARFRDHTLKIFENHGISNVGYWVPMENPDHKLIYLLSYPSREAREKSWKEFFADPEWKAAQKASEANGKLVANVESTFLTATDYSPEIKASRSTSPRVFELRTYTATEGKLGALHARFRDHTVGLFASHGMGQFGYWTPTDQKQGADNTLIYLLVHQSKEAAAKSFSAFRTDPQWMKAKADSEKDGPLTVKDGVKSVFVTPTDYSPTK